MMRPTTTHTRRRVLGAAVATLAAGGLVLAGSAELRSSTPRTGEHPMSDRVLEETPSRLGNLIRSIVHHLPGDSGELPVEGQLPAFSGATGWLNSEPQTPEFDFEHDVDNIIAQAGALGVSYPIAVDSDYGVWNAFDNHYWPAVFIADAQGRIRYHHFGEGEYAMQEMVIQQLLLEAGVEDVDPDLVSVDPVGLEVAADYQSLRSPETYLGYGQATGLASPDGLRADESHEYSPPSGLRLNQWAPSGAWSISRRAAAATAAKSRLAI